MNDSSQSLTKIIGIGKSHKQEKRAMSNVVVSKNPEIPVLSGTDKDHKECDVGEIKMRPMVNAMMGPKKALSEIYSKVINYVVECEETETVCKNTEELLGAFEEFNKNNENTRNTNDGKEKEKLIIGSMDAISLYPSIKVDRAEEIVKQKIIESDIKLEGLDVMEIGKYLRKNLTSKEIGEKGFKQLLPQKVKNKDSKHER